MKTKINNFAARLALKTAKIAAGAASLWNTYQPKEPEKLREIVSK